MPSVVGHPWETIDLEGVSLRVLSLDGLLLSKQGNAPHGSNGCGALAAGTGYPQDREMGSISGRKPWSEQADALP
jgi:hypothetical protein